MSLDLMKEIFCALPDYKCKLRHRPDGFAKQNGRGAERADTLAL